METTTTFRYENRVPPSNNPAQSISQSVRLVLTATSCHSMTYIFFSSQADDGYLTTLVFIVQINDSRAT